MKFAPALLAATLSVTADALANDSVATLGTGGLILVQADAVTMEKEDLYISLDQVRVDYVFRNNEKEPKTYLVAFPMPPIEAPGYLESDIAVPDRDKENFMNFTVTVDGKPVEAKLEMRALTGGIDVTDRLVALGIPLNPLAEATRQAANKVPRDKLAELITMGVFRPYEDQIDPSWSLKSTYYWLQTFPADTTLSVSHSYTPAAGSAFFYRGLLDEADYMQKFCVDEQTRKAIAKKLDRRPSDNPYLLLREISYILTTGANWQGAIGDFRLVVDKGKPDSVVSFCMDDVKKIAPTQFEVRRKDFSPARDLDVLVVEDLPVQ